MEPVLADDEVAAFARDGVVCLRSVRTSPPFDDLRASLPPGAAMDHPLFPVVWPT
jgi:hypothetical protein